MTATLSVTTSTLPSAPVGEVNPLPPVTGMPEAPYQAALDTLPDDIAANIRYGQVHTMHPYLKHPDQTEEYIAPDHPQAKALIRQNLLDKHKAWLGTEFTGNDFPFEIKTLTKPKTALITIKAETPHESKIRGYMCEFEMTAPVKLMKIMYEGGIGGKNSMGFGMVKSI